LLPERNTPASFHRRVLAPVLCSRALVKLTGASMTLSVDLFFSFRSPYSYLALPRTMKMVADYDVTVNLRPVYPLAVRVPGFFKRANPQFARYVVLDASRVAKHENIPFRFPRPDPIVQDMTTLTSPSTSPTSIA
jgi:2-hydroxychromene-2-carboxylate isomerase